MSAYMQIRLLGLEWREEGVQKKKTNIEMR